MLNICLFVEKNSTIEKKIEKDIDLLMDMFLFALSLMCLKVV